MLRDGEARTFKARQTSSGRIVLLHQLWVERTPPNQPDLASLVFGFLRRATAEEMKSLIDMGEEESRVFVVTEDLPGCEDLRQWLQSAPGRLPTVGKASASKSAPSGDHDATAATRSLASRARQEDLASAGGTQLFTTPKAIADQRLPASPAKPATTPTTHPELHVQPGTSASPDKLAGRAGKSSEAEVLTAAKLPVAPPPPSREMGEPGEFTRMFLGSPGASKARPATPSSADSRKAELSSLTAQEPPKGKDQPGRVGGELFAPTAEKPPQQQPPAGFEVVFASRKQQSRAPAPPVVEKPLPPPPLTPGGEKEAPGDFTRAFFGRGESKATPPSSEPAPGRTPLPSLAPDQRRQPEGAGEFTRLFQAAPVKEKPPAAPSAGAGQARSFAQPVQPTAQTPPPPPSTVESEGAGEFTRMFQAGAQPTRPAGPPIPTSSPRPPSPMSSSLSQHGPGEFTQLIQGYPSQKSEPTLPVLERPEPVLPPPPPSADKARPGEFTMIFQRPSEETPPPPSASLSLPDVQTPPTAPQSPEADEYMRMFELPSGGAGAPAQGARQAPTPAAPQPAAGHAVPAIPVASVSPPMVPSMPYVQPPMMPQPQPYQVPAPQFQQPAAPPAFAMAPQPVMPQMQPMGVPVPVAPQAAVPKTGKNRFLVPLIILGGLFLIAVVTILFFALKH